VNFTVVPVSIPPVISVDPVGLTVFQGDTATFTAAATGPEVSYQWRHNNSAIGGATNTSLALTNVTLGQAGAYTFVASNSYGSVTSAIATLVVIPTVPLPLALNATNLPWATGGDTVWHGLTNVSHDGFAAGHSGLIADGQTSTLSTTTNGPGTLSFWWKASSQTNAGFLNFLSSGGGFTNTARISGEADWRQATYYLGAGAQTLQ